MNRTTTAAWPCRKRPSSAATPRASGKPRRLADTLKANAKARTGARATVGRRARSQETASAKRHLRVRQLNRILWPDRRFCQFQPGPEGRASRVSSRRRRCWTRCRHDKPMSTRQDAQKLLDERRADANAGRTRSNRTLEFVLLLAAASIVGLWVSGWSTKRRAPTSTKRHSSSISIPFTTPRHSFRYLTRSPTAGTQVRSPPAFWSSRSTGTSPMSAPSPDSASSRRPRIASPATATHPASHRRPSFATSSPS